MEEKLIRRHFDPKEGVWYFSIVDVIAEMTESSSPNSYWKTLKNRFKKSGNQLVTQFNQLKMLAADGKYYLTDCANEQTIVRVLELIPSARVHAFMSFTKSLTGVADEAKKASAKPSKLLVDMYEQDGAIFIEALLPGVLPEDLKIIAGRKKISIEGKRELKTFSRTLTLPYPILVNKIEKEYDRGHLTIKLTKIT